MSKKTKFVPYQNESDCIQIGELTVENRLDCISIYGSIDLTRDKNGLAATRELKKIIDATLSELEKSDLPDKITLAESETVDNPFA
jgi:DNA-binding PucR family transcriptional regulator